MPVSSRIQVETHGPSPSFQRFYKGLSDLREKEIESSEEEGTDAETQNLRKTDRELMRGSAPHASLPFKRL